ncbi:MAG: hypothetical protein WCH77_05750 [Planctomycetota bacterium]
MSHGFPSRGSPKPFLERSSSPLEWRFSGGGAFLLRDWLLGFTLSASLGNLLAGVV